METQCNSRLVYYQSTINEKYYMKGSCNKNKQTNKHLVNCNKKKNIVSCCEFEK